MKKKLLIGIVGFSLLFTTPLLATNNYSPIQLVQAINLFGQVISRITNNYVTQKDPNKLVEEAIRGMVKTLDSHSSYLNAMEYQNMESQTRGEFVGIGTQIKWNKEEKAIEIIKPMENSPALRAGIKPGDLVIKIDDKKVSEIPSFQEAISKITGEPNTVVKITIKRKGVKEPIQFFITRERIISETVKYYILNNNIMYVSLSIFDEHSGEKVSKAINSMLNKLNEKNIKPKGLILDLRGNPGGLLYQAIAISDMFLKDGKIVEIRPRNEANREISYASPPEIVNHNLPLIILIDENSASASEIVSGTLKDNKRAILVGVKSYGKGSVQTISPLSNGGALRLTIALYYTAGGTTPNNIGIIPNYIVELPENYWKNNNFYDRGKFIDPQLQKAIDVISD